MPEERPIIIQQTQNQSCCAGAGCGSFLLIFLLFAGFGAIWGALSGEYGTGWQVVAWIAVPLAVAGMAVTGVAGVALARERLGKGSAAHPGSESRRHEERESGD